MIFTLPNILTADELADINRRIDKAPLSDGARTAGKANAKRKNNREVTVSSPERKELDGIVRAALDRNNDIRLITQPKFIGNILFSLYGEGAFYSDHSDNTLMNGPERFRADLSATIFLNDPTDYDGGELVINTDIRPESVKLPKGSIVLYPTTVLHRVNPVRRGERRVAILWMQSLIRSPEQRQALLDIGIAISFFIQNTPQGKEHPEAIRLEKVYGNLVRQWAEV